MIDLAQRSDLATNRVVTSSALEELEGTNLILDDVTYSVDVGEAPAPEDLLNLEAATDHVADVVLASGERRT